MAPLTPFTADLKVDTKSLRRQMDYIVDDCKATVVVAAGVETQEYTYLSYEERKNLVRATIEAVDGRIPVMVGISHPNYITSIDMAHFAEKDKGHKPFNCWRRCVHSPGRRHRPI